MKLRTFFILFFVPLSFSIFANDVEILSSSKINWETKTFSSTLTLDFNKANLKMPADRSVATDKMMLQLPRLIKDALLSTAVNSTTHLGDLILQNNLTFDSIRKIIDAGKNSPSYFSPNKTEILFGHSFDLNLVSALLVQHKHTNRPIQPIEHVATRDYTGIIIDARGILPIHGVFASSALEPCLFPQIWDDQMELLYDKNMVDPAIVKEQGLVQFCKGDNASHYAHRVGDDPLKIVARGVYGIYPTDPIIARNDALKILCSPHNIDLLRQGKVVILIDDNKVQMPMSAIVKTDDYDRTYDNVSNYLYESKIKDLIVDDTYKGILLSMQNIQFMPESAVIMPGESDRLDTIANALKIATDIGSFNIRVEGHTARYGDISTEQPLSEQRAQTIVNEFISRGISVDIFQVRGFGGERPVATNDTQEGRSLNRRVEIIIEPKSSTPKQ